ncbi:GNAT family N-acetyltransferase [Roseateles sp. DB2]|uniref:GNAT family N-acetyltransferase n=1 Tax=Roseateles sp. DB2 TaxID=3453717 RepID=UPI003EEBB823
MSSEFDLRPLQLADLDAVLRLQSDCYGAVYVEPAEAFASKLRETLSLQTCWGVFDGAGTLLAYAISLPVCADTMPSLHASDYHCPAAPTLLYLHDVAVGSRGRGRGLAQSLLAQIEQRALRLGLARVGLIAVQDSAPFWQRLGFAPLPSLPAWLGRKLQSFGEAARYLERVSASG